MKIAYLVNQYPKISHSFIRRELRAVETQVGSDVLRMTIRATLEPLVDPADQEEQALTRELLAGGAKGLLPDVASMASREPRRFARASAMAARLGYRSDRGIARHGAYLAEACRVVRWCAEEGVTHLHAHFGSNPAAVAMLARELGGPTFSFTAHGTETFDFPPFIGIPEKVAHAAFVVAVSEYGRSQLCRWSAREHWSKIHVVRCGADEAFTEFEPTPIPKEPRLVCVARLSGEKGHLVLMDACALLKKRDVRFMLELVGDGDLRPQIESLVAEYDLGDSIRFAGWGDTEMVRTAVSRSRALVLPSFMEGLPVVLMEAFALGRPAISTHVSGIPELVSPGETGWLVPAGAAEPLADAMQAAIEATPEYLNTLGANGRARVLNNHDASKEAARLVELIHEYS